MRILEINIQNFRKLLQCHIEFSEKTTLFVGANNSGKTSAMDALGKFLADRNFTFNDITISERYTENEEMVRDTALANGWFLENEIYIV